MKLDLLRSKQLVQKMKFLIIGGTKGTGKQIIQPALEKGHSITALVRKPDKFKLQKQEKIIKKSDLDWTIVRPGQLTNGKKRSVYKHGEGLGHYVLTKMISRADVAHFILNELETNNYIRKTPAVTY